MSPGWPDEGEADYVPLKEKTAEFFARVTQKSGRPGAHAVADLIVRIMGEEHPLPGYGIGPMSDDFLVERMKGDEAGWRDLVDRELGIKGMRL